MRQRAAGKIGTILIILLLAANFPLAPAAGGAVRPAKERRRPPAGKRLQIDYAKRKISLDKYLRYKLWLTTNPKKLARTKYRPAKAEAKLYRRGLSPTILEIKKNWRRLKSGTRKQLKWVFKRPTDIGGGVDSTQHLLPQLHTSANGNFVIHWTNGADGGQAADAPPPADANGDGVPNYIEWLAYIFEYVRSIEVANLGYQAPLSDAGKANDANNANPDEKYDVFVYNLGPLGIYGYTDPELYPTTPSYGYIGVDNDYAGYPGSGVGNMQVTAAHEYFHAVQFTYDVTEESWWMEASATYIEDEVYPLVNDNYRYLPYWFDNVDQQGLASADGVHEYGSFIFAKRLSEDFGDQIIREIWQEAKTTNGLAATGNVLAAKGSGLAQEFDKFARANYFLESMYADGADYRLAITGKTTFGAVWREYDFTEASATLPLTIDSQNVNRDAWMDKWAADYVKLKMSGQTPGYAVYFDGLDPGTNYSVSLITKAGAAIMEEPFSLNAQKDGSLVLPYDPGRAEVVLAVKNEGNLPTANPSWKITLKPLYTLAQLSNNNFTGTFADGFPQVENGKVVWQGTDGNDDEIFMYDGAKTVQLSRNNYSDWYPMISNGQVVWSGYDGVDWEVFFYNGGRTYRLTNNNYDDWDPQIDRGKITWTAGNDDGREIMLYDSASGATTQLTNNNFADRVSQISRGKVVWTGFDGVGWEIYLFDGVNTSQLTNTGKVNFYPRIHNNDIVWGGFDGQDWEIFHFNGAQTEQLTNNTLDDIIPDISAGQIAWRGFDGSDWEIFLFDGSATKQLTYDAFSAGNPAIDHGQVVWSNQDGTDGEIWHYNGGKTIRITNNSGSDWYPTINNGQIAWSGYDGNDWEVFLAKPY